jgi:SAM-dependent methyltransferase
MKRSLTISTNDGLPAITFNSFPFWKGVQKKSGVTRAIPFVLAASIEGPIRQVTSGQVVDDVVKAYESDEYNFITAPPGASAWGNSLGERSVKAVEKAVGPSRPKNILEIGGGSTWVARKLQERYLPDSYLIVDPAIRETAEGVEIINDYFPNRQLTERRFDLVLGFSVLEHVPDPLNFLRNIRKQLTDNGKVILIYPDCERQLRRGDLNVLVHEHLSYFTEASSRWLASAAGFDVLSLGRENDAFTLCLRAHASNVDSPPNLDESGLLLQSANSFQTLLTITAQKIEQHLGNNQFVGFHGATPGLNSFLHITGLGDHKNIRLYDGDASKEGRFLPACSTPIFPPTEKSYAENSVMVVSAMSFFEQIEKFATEKARFDASRLIPLIGA